MTQVVKRLALHAPTDCASVQTLDKPSRAVSSVKS